MIKNMDLWIRSQDKKELIPNPKLGIDQCENRYYIVDRYDFERAFILGEYKSKERALEVLDEIDKYKNKLEKAHFLGMEESEFVSSTFQMPEE